MKLRRLIGYIIMIMIISIFVVTLVYRKRQVEKLDIVAVNDIVQTITKNWEELDQDKLLSLDYDLDYVVLDNLNQVVTYTREGLRRDINLAIANRDTIVDVVKDGKLVGKLIIYNETPKLWIDYRNSMVSYIVVCILILGSFCILYICYLEKSIFRPFYKLKNFARRVALGDLEIPLEMDKGNRFGAFTESFDLMREELKKSRESERAANQSKKELVASLSHDIKTPVASIKAVTEVLQVKSKEENMKKQLEIITTKADQINSLITNMFTATLEELQELKVNAIEQSSIFLYELIDNADYNHQVTISKRTECIILADELRLSQVIDNIISNSYKYAGTSIDVSFQIIGRFLEVAFRDYGLGVSKEEEMLIFHKFYRARNTSNISGAGLGLYISKHLMERMSGEIESEKLTEGFVIRIRLKIV